jgi:hypothetical protein
MTNPDAERIQALITELENVDRAYSSPYTTRLMKAAAIEQLRADHPAQGERTPQDYAIEFGEYLAKSAEAFMHRVNDYPYDCNEEWCGLRSAVYEFRKRAARCVPDVHVAVSPEAVDEVIARMPPPVAPARTEATPAEQGGGGATAASGFTCSQCNKIVNAADVWWVGCSPYHKDCVQ